MVRSNTPLNVVGAADVARKRIRQMLQTGELKHGAKVNLNLIMPGLTNDEQDRICDEQLAPYVGAAVPDQGIHYTYSFAWLAEQRRLVIYTPAAL